MPKIRTLSATTAVGWIVQGGWAAGIEEEVAVVRLMVGGRAAIVWKFGSEFSVGGLNVGVAEVVEIAS